MLVYATVKDAEIKTFESPEKGFDYIRMQYAKEGKEEPTVLFLDIDMPTWSGWDFLESFERLEEKIKRQIRIYMLSSSIDPKDREYAKQNRNVVDYIEKPLNKHILLSCLEEASVFYNMNANPFEKAIHFFKTQIRGSN